MSIYDKASLVLIPSGTKTSKVYSQKPVSGDGDFTFSRSTAATRVNASGNIEKETQNLMRKSNTLSDWSNSATAETGGQSGYDGSNDAWLIEKSAANGFIGIPVSYSGVFTQSIYAKAGTLNWVAIQNSGISQTLAWFDLQNGVTGLAQSSVISHSITDVGNGWYRCEATYNGTSGTFRVFPSVSDNNTSGTSGNIYIQDAQLEQGLVARDYIETTTTAIYGGITDNVPRLDYTDSSCPALLLEPQRTNLVTNSEYSISYPVRVNIAFSQNTQTSPEGLINASTITSDTTSAAHYFGFNNTSVTNGTSYSASLFVKKGTGRYFQLLFGSGGFTINSYANFDLQDGLVAFEGADADASIIDYGNGWYRCSITSTAGGNANDTLYAAVITTATAARVQSHTTSLDYYIYGGQVEAGSYATSYIPTYGSAVTRERDNCDLNDVSNIRGDRKGTIYVEGKLNSFDVQGVMPLTFGSGTSNLIYIWLYTNGRIYADIFTNGTQVSALNTASGFISEGDSFKIAVAYQDNDAVLYVNGSLIESDNDLLAPNPNLLRIGKYNAAGYTGGSYTNAMVFPTRLSNEELATLTTI
jgi:hypothetical protein